MAIQSREIRVTFRVYFVWFRGSLRLSTETRTIPETTRTNTNFRLELDVTFEATRALGK